MCLIVFDWKPTSYPSLVVAANRDEVFDRPSQTAHFWKDEPTIYGGRDVVMGGTWLACSTTGRFAAVTNYHEPRCKGGCATTRKSYSKSRGEIPVMFVSEKQQLQQQSHVDSKMTTTTSTETAALSSLLFVKTRLEVCREEFGGFNAILFDGQSLVYCSNRGERKNAGDEQYSFIMQELPAGLYGVSNHLLNTPWPKVEKAKVALSDALSTMEYESSVPAPPPPSSIQATVVKEDENSTTITKPNNFHTQIAQRLIKAMEDTTKVVNLDLLPWTLGVEEEIIRSSIFVEGVTFGTRTTTIVTFDRRYGFDMTEKNHHHNHHRMKTFRVASSEEEDDDDEEESSLLHHHQRIEIHNRSDPPRRRRHDDGFNKEKVRI